MDRLFSLDPGDFVAARDALAAEARSSGDRTRAQRIKGLRRPTVSAWVVNLLAREESASVGELLELGEALRAAHQTLSADELRPLAAQRTQVVEALTRRAARLAADHGHPPSEAVRAEVAGSLQAALADPEVAETVRRGRLSKPVSYSGFGLVESRPAAERPPVVDLSAARDRRRSRKEREAEQARAKAVAEARERLETLRSALVDARAAHSEAEEQHLEAAEELDRRSQEVADLRDELAAAEAAEAEAQEAEGRTRSALAEAEQAVERAEAEAEEAQHALEELGEG
ncbi:hypothetical protein DT076_16120 [Desertihabitans brevis]|uniref:Uncharacterized protein n=1 Tax=Desertihabitans brevis TaxID=2268447 RepID=A0A367YRI8_9ACTN|nr:hypothetical protein DT076_16120 [Desertihabitans brevis]